MGIGAMIGTHRQGGDDDAHKGHPPTNPHMEAYAVREEDRGVIGPKLNFRLALAVGAEEEDHLGKEIDHPSPRTIGIGLRRGRVQRVKRRHQVNQLKGVGGGKGMLGGGG